MRWNPYTEKGNDHRDQIEKCGEERASRTNKDGKSGPPFSVVRFNRQFRSAFTTLYSPATRTLARHPFAGRCKRSDSLIDDNCIMLHVHNCKPKSNPRGLRDTHKCDKGKIKENWCFCGIVMKMTCELG